MSPTWGTKILNATWYSKKKKERKKERKTRKNKRLQTYPISRHGNLRLVGGFALWAYLFALRDLSQLDGAVVFPSEAEEVNS